MRFIAEQLTLGGGTMKMAHLGGVLNRERRDMKAKIGRVRGFVEDHPDMFSIAKEGGAWVIRFAADPMAAQVKEGEELLQVRPTTFLCILSALWHCRSRL